MEKSDRPTNWAVFVLDSMFIVVIYARISNYWSVSIVISTNSLCLMFASFRLDDFFVFSFNIYKSFWLFIYLLRGASHLIPGTIQVIIDSYSQYWLEIMVQKEFHQSEWNSWISLIWIDMSKLLMTHTVRIDFFTSRNQKLHQS